MLVDDDQQVRQLVSRVLQKAGFDVHAVASGVAAHRLLDVTQFDLLVSDIGLPDISGLQILRAVRSRDAELPVILMTGSGDLPTAMQAVELRAFRYLTKPLSPAVLERAAVEAVTARAVSRRTSEALEQYEQAAASAEHQRHDLEVRFDEAIEQLQMAYQPIVRAADNDTLFGFEALLRSGDRSLAFPTAFLDAAETLGRVHDLGRAVRRSVARTLLGFAPEACVFVNLHPTDLEDDDLYSPLTPLSRVATRVVLEVTERAELGSPQDLPSRLIALRRLGYRIAVDDLGAGYAGLASLVQLQPEVVKFDMSLIREVHQDPTKRKLITAMTSLCGELGATTVAEGVETPPERDALLGLGCELMQGYLIARPVIGPPSAIWPLPAPGRRIHSD